MLYYAFSYNVYSLIFCDVYKTFINAKNNKTEMFK